VVLTGPRQSGKTTLLKHLFARRCRYVSLESPDVRAAAWYAKTEPTFSDALANVRRLLWLETILKRRAHGQAFRKLPPQVRDLLLDSLTRAA